MKRLRAGARAGGDGGPITVDHVDQCRTNAAPENLRPATASEQRANQRKDRLRRDGTRGFIGVSRRLLEGEQRYRATFRGRDLGTFSAEADAAAAWDDAAVRAGLPAERLNDPGRTA